MPNNSNDNLQNGFCLLSLKTKQTKPYSSCSAFKIQLETCLLKSLQSPLPSLLPFVILSVTPLL